ncbi:hypothetical protein [Herbaspirillum rubrisubalbicans]|nr:hypothetical protein [Herbaspirillum rubrisubalbicans]
MFIISKHFKRLEQADAVTHKPLTWPLRPFGTGLGQRFALQF